MRTRVGTALILLALGSGCGAATTGVSDGESEIRVLFNNQSGQTLLITVGGAAFAQRTVTVPNCPLNTNCYTDEFPGVAGNTLTLSAAGVGGGSVSGTGTCKANVGIVGIAPAPSGSPYGQVNIYLAGSTVSFVCVPGTEWQ